MTVRSLADALRASTDAELAALLSARPELLTPVPVDMSQLAYRAASGPAVARALDRLDRWHLQTLEAACISPAGTREDLYALLEPAPRAAVDAAVHDLRTQVLLWDDGTHLHPVTGAREAAAPAPRDIGPPLELTVGSLSPARRMDLAADLGLPAPPDTDTAIDAIVAVLADPEHVATLLEGAPGAAVELLQRLAEGPPVGTVERADRAVRVEDATSPVDWLLAHGLLAALDPRTVVLPLEIGVGLRGGRAFAQVAWEPPPLTGPDDPSPVDTAHVDRTAAGQADTCVRLVEDLLEAWSVDPPAVLKSGGLGVRDLRRTAARLDLEEWQAALLVETAYAAGLLAAGGPGDAEWLPSPAYDRWRTEDTADRWVRLVTAWLASPRVAGLVGSRDDREKVVAALGPDLDRWVAVHVRDQIVRLLAIAPPGTVVGADRLDAVLAWVRPRQSWGLRSALVGWTLREAEMLGVTGAGALSRAGRGLAADTGGPGGDVGDATPVDELAWADGVAAALAPLLPEPVDHVLLQADLTAVAPGPLVPELARALAIAADVESTGGATVYRFTPGSVRRALDAGQTADDLHALLATHSRTPVPQPLTYLVDDLARRHGRIRVGGAGAYVRCDDTAVLDELVALGGSRGADLRLRRIAPTVLSSPASADVLLARLRELGYAPAAESSDGAVIIRRPDARRAASAGRTRVPAPRGGLGAPAPALLEAAVRAMRAGDRAAQAPRGAMVEGMAASGVVPRTAAASTLGLLRLAIEEARPVWIGYVDTHGGVTERVVDPVRLGGGYLTAYDHRSERVHSFAVHRITGVAALDGAPDEA